MTATEGSPAIPGPDAYHMTGDEFRELGHQLVDFIADYHDNVGDHPVLSQVQPGDVAAQLPRTPPEHGDGLATLLDDLNQIVVPGLTHWQSPNFHGYFSCNATGPSILGEFLSAGFGVNGMLWATSPAVTEIETRVMDWMVDLCDLPKAFHSSGTGGGVILDSASSSTLTAMVAARHRTVGHRPAPELRAYTSSQAHSSVQKGMRVAGFSDDQLRVIDTDETFAMRADLLAEAIAADKAAGHVPFFVSATVGTTSSSALDPVPAIAEVCGDDIWLHVDAAYAGSASVVPELRFVNEGLDQADSYVFNPHKWLLTNFDCSLFYVRSRASLNDALSIVPEYLRNEASESGQVIDYRDWQIPLGRRFRALKLWMVIRWYGAEGLRAFIRAHVELGQELSVWIDADHRFERLTPTPLSTLCFAHVDGDDKTREILEKINADGNHLLTQTLLDGRYTIRVAIGSVRTAREHIEHLWADITALA